MKNEDGFEYLLLTVESEMDPITLLKQIDVSPRFLILQAEK